MQMNLIYGMISRISNPASLQAIESQLHSKFDYGHLYTPKSVINGKKEATVCLVTTEAPDQIQYGIWGLLPEGYKDSWKSFQTFYNTLEIECESITTKTWQYDALKNRRCLIIATGFFTGEVVNNMMQYYFTSLRNNQVFCFAGIYNVLEDGFLSCSILSHSLNTSQCHMYHPRPILITKQHYAHYLSKKSPLEFIRNGTFELAPKELIKQDFGSVNTSLYDGNNSYFNLGG